MEPWVTGARNHSIASTAVRAPIPRRRAPETRNTSRLDNQGRALCPCKAQGRCGRGVGKPGPPARSSSTRAEIDIYFKQARPGGGLRMLIHSRLVANPTATGNNDVPSCTPVVGPEASPGQAAAGAGARPLSKAF